VRASIGGDSGVMVAIRRLSNQPYRAEYHMVPLATAARRERLFPAEWIAPQGNDVQPDYFGYIRPLVGEVTRHFRS
jgi:ATP-dependent phosphofructokinase / diphosphate-dependent phosphofructokinase